MAITSVYSAVSLDRQRLANVRLTSSGTQQIAVGIAALIGWEHVYLSCPVSAIEDLGTHVEITTAAGDVVAARKCIISIPSTMYRDLDISPSLPCRTQAIVDNTKLGDYNKVIVCYDSPWWREKGFNGFFMSYTGPIALARDTSIDELSHYSLTCFVNGEMGRRWSRLHPHERRAAVLHQIARVYKVEADSEAYRPIEMFDQIWMHEKYSKGALVPVTALGHLTGYADVYGKPVGNLHFVGTEYSTEWKGYMEGALCSGEVGAEEVVSALRGREMARL